MPNLEKRLNRIMSTLQLEDAPAGGSLVVYRKGKLIAESNVGAANPQLSWDKHTLSLNFSTGKGVLVTLIHILVSNGTLEYEKPIAHYWSNFAQNGKQHIKLKDVLTHQSGLFNVKLITDDAMDMTDWELMLSRVEKMACEAPSNAKSESAYSALVSGWVLGGLIEKATGLELNEALNIYLAEPLDIKDQIYFGVPEDKISNVATLEKYFNVYESKNTNSNKSGSHKPKLNQDTHKIIEAYKSLPSYDCWKKTLITKKNTSSNQNGSNAKDISNLNVDLKTLGIASLYFDMRSIELQDFKNALMPSGKTIFNYYTAEGLMSKIPAANNVASANALAKIYAMLANKGGWEGKQLISPEVFNKLNQVYVNGSDAIMPASNPNSMQWRLGYHRLFSVCIDNDLLNDGFGHMGYNGSVAWCDIHNELAVAFVHNYDVTMSTDIRQFALTEAILKWFY